MIINYNYTNKKFIFRKHIFLTMLANHWRICHFAGFFRAVWVHHAIIIFQNGCISIWSIFFQLHIFNRQISRIDFKMMMSTVQVQLQLLEWIFEWVWFPLIELITWELAPFIRVTHTHTNTFMCEAAIFVYFFLHQPLSPSTLRLGSLWFQTRITKYWMPFNWICHAYTWVWVYWF